jgi:hypothetical protein
MLVFGRAGSQELCITRPGVWTTIARGPLPPKLAPDAVTNLGAGFGHLGFGPLISFVAANTGSAVTGVRLTLHDGQRVTATVAHGWAIAWWPGASYEASATVSTRRRTFSFPIAPPRWLQNCSLLRILHLHFPCQRRT